MLARWTLLLISIAALLSLLWLAAGKDPLARAVLGGETLRVEAKEANREVDLTRPLDEALATSTLARVEHEERVVVLPAESPSEESDESSEDKGTPVESVSGPWQLDVLNAVTEQRLRGSVTVRDAAEEAEPRTVNLPAVFPSEWRNRVLVLEAEGFRSVLINNDTGADEKVSMLCPIRNLELEIRPPLSEQAKFLVALDEKRRRLRSFEVEVEDPRVERVLLGVQSELRILVTPQGSLGMRTSLFEGVISLQPVGDTRYVIDLESIPFPGHGTLQAALLFEEPIYGTPRWQVSVRSLEVNAEGESRAWIRPVGIGGWTRSANGLRYDVELGRVVEGLYRLSFEPLGLEQEFQVRANELSEVVVDVPPLATVDVGLIWNAAELESVAQKRELRVSYIEAPSGMDVLESSSLMREPKAKAEPVEGANHLYRFSALPGADVSVSLQSTPAGLVGNVSHTCIPGHQRVSLKVRQASSPSLDELLEGVFDR